MSPLALEPRLLSQLAHELRSPLNVVTSSLAELLREPSGLSAEDRALMLGLSQRAVARLVALSDRLSLAGRIGSGNGLEAALQPLDLVALTRHALATFTTSELRQRIEVHPTYPPEPVMVRADPALLATALRELFSNANRHARRQLGVEVIGGGAPAVAVDDDGEGVPPEERPLLFEAFADRRNRTGLGMGLWLASALIQLQHGTLTVEDRAPGTRQLLRLPALGEGA